MALQKQQRCRTCGGMRVSHKSKDPQLYRWQGPINEQLPSRTPQQYSVDKLPHTRGAASYPADGRQACIASKPAGCCTRPALVVCFLLSVWCQGYVHHNLKKNGNKKDVISARIELAPSNPKSGIMTISPNYQTSILLFSRFATHRTHMHSSTAEEGEVVITNHGSQPPIKQVATAAHHRPATLAWCGPRCCLCW